MTIEQLGKFKVGKKVFDLLSVISLLVNCLKSFKEME